jgi:hypothetical protein
MSKILLAFCLVVFVACGGGSGDPGGGLGPTDPRCESLCASNDMSCANDVAECKPVCQVRVAGFSAPCSTCLLDGAHGGACSPGVPCCPDPQFRNTVIDCAGMCAGSKGINPGGNHPICTALCSSDDMACAADVASCMQTCQARIQGVSGLCAICLLEGANGGSCSGGASCCPHPQFPRPATACAALCSG